MADEAVEPQQDEETAPKRNFSKAWMPLAIAMAIMLVIAIGMAVAVYKMLQTEREFMLKHLRQAGVDVATLEQKQEDQGWKVWGDKNENVKDVQYTDLEEFLINLADEDGGHYLRVKVSLMHPQSEEVTNYITTNTPKIRDEIIAILTSKVSSEIVHPSGKNKVKGEILTSLQKKMPKTQVMGIFFLNFTMQ